VKLSKLVSEFCYGREKTTTRTYILTFDNAEKLTPLNKSWVFLGVAYTGLENDEEAEEAYKRAIEINSDNMLGWHGLVSFYEKRNKLEPLAKTIDLLIPRVIERFV
jgi:tetratricopeptide (TPR) repeat protein